MLRKVFSAIFLGFYRRLSVMILKKIVGAPSLATILEIPITFFLWEKMIFFTLLIFFGETFAIERYIFLAVLMKNVKKNIFFLGGFDP